MANFSPASETNPIKIKLLITWRGIQSGLKILARFLQTGLGFTARPNGLENLKKSHVIETEFQPGQKKQETIWLPLGSRSDFSGIKAIKERFIFVVSLISKLR